MKRVWTVTVVILAISVALASTADAGRKKNKKQKADAPAGLSEDLTNEVWAVFERGTRSADMQTRAQAVLTLGRIRPEKATVYTTDALQDPQWIVRHSAIRAMIRAGNPAYRKTLGAAVANSRLYENPKLSPLDLVLELPTDEAIELLGTALEKVDDVRSIILQELFKEDSPLAREFYEGLRNLAPVKSWVMKNLDIFKDKNMYPLLVKTIPQFSKQELLRVFKFMEGLDQSYDYQFFYKYMDDDDQETSEAAAINLGIRGEHKAVDFFLGMCDENDVRRQLRCLDGAVGVYSHPDVSERAKLFLYGDPDPEVLYKVYDLFCRAKDDSIYDRMVARLESTNMGHRAAAVYFIGKMKGNRALPKLHKLLRDGSPIIRLRAAQALGELRQAESVTFIDDALRNDLDAGVKRALVEALGHIGDSTIVPVVSFLIFDPEVKDSAITALCKVRHRSAIATLRNVLQTQFTREQRAKALKAIVSISPAEGLQIFKGALGWIPEGFLLEAAKDLKGDFVPYLKAAMGSINERVRREAVLAFKFVGADTETKVLERELFSSKDIALREAILERISDVKKGGSLPLLQSFFKDSNRELRLASMRLSADYAKPGDDTSKALKAQLLDPDETYRVAAAAALTRIHLGKYVKVDKGKGKKKLKKKMKPRKKGSKKIRKLKKR